MKHYKDLTDALGAPGHEREVRKLIMKRLSKVANDVEVDEFGNIYAFKYGEEEGIYGPAILITAHMDEVGLMITKILPNGLLKFIPIGGIDPVVLVSQAFYVVTQSGEKIPAVIGAVPPHIGKNDQLSVDDLSIDIGASSQEEALSWGIQPGDYAVFQNRFFEMKDPNKVVAKAWDNRFGVGMVVEILEELKNEEHDNTVVAVLTTQEEVGLRGMRLALKRLGENEENDLALCLAIDVSPAGDTLPAGHPRAFGKLGEGFLLRFYDSKTIMHNGLKQYIRNLAKEKGIKYQDFLSFGSTDAAEAQYSTLATTIGLPGRYIHGAVSMVDKRDMEAVKQIVLAIIRNMNTKRFEEIKKNV